MHEQKDNQNGSPNKQAPSEEESKSIFTIDKKPIMPVTNLKNNGPKPPKT